MLHPGGCAFRRVSNRADGEDYHGICVGFTHRLCYHSKSSVSNDSLLNIIFVFTWSIVVVAHPELVLCYECPARLIVKIKTQQRCVLLISKARRFKLVRSDIDPPKGINISDNSQDMK